LIYNQYRYARRNAMIAALTEPPSGDDMRYRAVVEQTVPLISAVSGKHNVVPILVFHPNLKLLKDGTARTTYQQDDLSLLKEKCAEQGVVFVDMTDVFLRAYGEDHILPHGFANTEIGTGHINRHGHRMVAEEIYRIITQKEMLK